MTYDVCVNAAGSSVVCKHTLNDRELVIILFRAIIERTFYGHKPSTDDIIKINVDHLTFIAIRI